MINFAELNELLQLGKYLGIEARYQSSGEDVNGLTFGHPPDTLNSTETNGGGLCSR